MKSNKSRLPRRPITSPLFSKTENSILSQISKIYWQCLDTVKKQWFQLMMSDESLVSLAKVDEDYKERWRILQNLSFVTTKRLGLLKKEKALVQLRKMDVTLEQQINLIINRQDVAGKAFLEELKTIFGKEHEYEYLSKVFVVGDVATTLESLRAYANFKLMVAFHNENNKIDLPAQKEDKLVEKIYRKYFDLISRILY